MNGPVPAPFVRNVSVVAPFSTMKVFLFVIRSGSSATGFAVVNLTAYGPAGWMPSFVRKDICDAPSDPVFGSITRRNVYTTSADVKGLPSQNLTPLRSWNVQTVPLAFG